MTTSIPIGLRASACAALLLSAAAACSDITVEGGQDVAIQISADASTVQVGESLTFQYNAVGTFLSGVVLEWGDGTADSLGAFGAQSSSGQRSHAWESAGQYTVVGKAVDGAQGTATNQLSILVTAGPASSPR